MNFSTKQAWVIETAQWIIITVGKNAGFSYGNIPIPTFFNHQLWCKFSHQLWQNFPPKNCGKISYQTTDAGWLADIFGFFSATPRSCWTQKTPSRMDVSHRADMTCCPKNQDIQPLPTKQPTKAPGGWSRSGTPLPKDPCAWSCRFQLLVNGEWLINISHSILGGGFNYFLMFIPIWGHDPIWRSYFFKWVVKNHQLVFVFFFLLGCISTIISYNGFHGWFGGLVVFGFPIDPPKWKGLLIRATPRIPNHRDPNQQWTVSCVFFNLLQNNMFFVEGYV